jgi:hypothetical protein
MFKAGNRIYSVLHLTLYISVFMFCCSCNAQTKIATSNSGLIHRKTLIFDSSQNIFVTLPQTRTTQIWFKDSLVIQEVNKIEIDTDTAGITRWRAYVLFYTLTDLRTLTIYNYKTFSDTATFFQKFSYTDSPNLFLGWNFFSTNAILTTNREYLSDTIINDIKYQRIAGSKFTDEENQFYQTRVGYISCDPRFSRLLTFDNVVTTEKKCPVTKIEMFDRRNHKRLMSEQEYQRFFLTEAELKVFNAWEKNLDRKN